MGWRGLRWWCACAVAFAAVPSCYEDEPARPTAGVAGGGKQFASAGSDGGALMDGGASGGSVGGGAEAVAEESAGRGSSLGGQEMGGAASGSRAGEGGKALGGTGGDDEVAGAAGAGGAASSSKSRIYFVRADAPEGGDGTSWAKAYANLELPLSYAAEGDQIWVAGGTYRPGGDRQNYYALKKGVAVYGGFDGVSDSRLAERDPVLHETILDGDLGDNDEPPGRGQGIDDDSRVLVRAESVGSTALLDGFTLQYDSMGYPEGTLDIFGEAPSLRNLKLRFRTFGYGGGLAFHGVLKEPVVYENLVFEDNAIWGIMIEGSVDFTCRHCSFKGNGGALEVAGDWYGPITAKLVDSDIEATSDYPPGPGPSVDFSVRGPADVTIEGCRIHGRPDQKIAIVQDAALHIVDSVLSGYTTAYQPYDAFIQLTPTDPDVLTSLDFVSTTLFGTGTADGILFQVFDGGPTRLRIYDSVLSNPTQQLDLWPGADLTIVANHSALPDIAGPGNIAGDPKLDADGRPLPGSPLLDAGTLTVPDDLLADSGDLDHDGNTQELIPVDAGGAKRIVDYPPASAAVIDIGAFEAHQ